MISILAADSLTTRRLIPHLRISVTHSRFIRGAGLFVKFMEGEI